MENNIFLNSLKNHFFISVSMLGKIIEICSIELWNNKKSGFVFWQQLIHTFFGTKGWLRDQEVENIPFSEINGKNIYPEFEKDPEIKEIAREWFLGKDDEWLKSLYKYITK
jgi:hypothetical protein